jgi:hypothetical protein
VQSLNVELARSLRAEPQEPNHSLIPVARPVAARPLAPEEEESAPPRRRGRSAKS